MLKLFNKCWRFICEKKIYFIIGVDAFIAGIMCAGILAIVWTQSNRPGIKQIRAERDTAIERYRELEETVADIERSKLEYERFYCEVADTVTRIGETNSDSLSTIAGLKQIVEALRDTVQSFEDNYSSSCSSEYSSWELYNIPDNEGE